MSDDGRRQLDAVGKQLLKAASELLASQGPAALTVRRISAAAHVSTMSLYDRFGDKNGVVEELFIEGFEGLTAATLGTSNRTGSRIGDVQLGMNEYRAWALAHRTHYAVMFTPIFLDFKPSIAAITIAFESFDVLVRAVTRAIDSGELRAAKPFDVALSLWAATHGHVALELSVGGSIGLNADHFDQTISMMLQGLRSDQDAPR